MHRLKTGLIFLCLAIVGCARLLAPGDDDYDGGNQLVNPGFEMDRAGWRYMDASPYWINFEVSDQVARSGRRSARIHIEQLADGSTRRALVAGIVQEPRPARFPERVGGWYRVDEFEKSDDQTDLYLQLVVIVWGDPRTPEIVSPENPPQQLKNYQLRYYLAGITEPPFVLINAKLQFVEKQSKPEMGTWVHFEMPVRADFQKLWGTVPEGYNRIRLLFEARWDNLPAGGSALADVYFDDLYFDYGP